MLTRTERACLVIADISGYTGYLAGSELDHAQDVLADLLEVVVGGIGPVLRLAKLEGDAVFTYAPEAEVDGSMLLDTPKTATLLSGGASGPSDRPPPASAMPVCLSRTST